MKMNSREWYLSERNSPHLERPGLEGAQKHVENGQHKGQQSQK